MKEEELSSIMFYFYNGVWIALLGLMLSRCGDAPCDVDHVVEQELHVYCTDETCVSPGAHTERFYVLGSQVFNDAGDEVGAVDLVECRWIP